jgi:hypothetical protein
MKLLTFILILLLSSLLVGISNVESVKASETIYIRADGSVEGTDKIQRDGNVYTFIDDIFDSCALLWRGTTLWLTEQATLSKEPEVERE